VRVGSLFSGIGGIDEGLEQDGMEIVWQVEKEPFALAVLATRYPNVQRETDITTCRGLTASVPASHARMFPSQESGLGSRESAQDSFTSLRESCESFDPLGLCSRMFPDFSVQTKEETLQKCSGFSWSSAGMGFRGACSTASFSESPNVARVCSLSDILESHVPLRFYLSPRACRGVLRRAEKRKRTLQSRLQAALAFVGSLQDDEWKTILTSLCVEPSTNSPEARTTTRASKGISLRRPSTEHGLKADQGKATTQSELSPPQLEPSNRTANVTAMPCLHSRRRKADKSSRTLSVLALDTMGTAALGETVQTISSPRQSQPVMENSQTPATATEDRQMSYLLVRRLTPTECEILQGFPLGWTVPDIEHWGTRSRSRSCIGSVKGSSQRKNRRSNRRGTLMASDKKVEAGTPKRIQRVRTKGWKMPRLTSLLGAGILHTWHGVNESVLLKLFACSVIGVSTLSLGVAVSNMLVTTVVDGPATTRIAENGVPSTHRFVLLLQRIAVPMKHVSTARGDQNSLPDLVASVHRVQNPIRLSWRFITAMVMVERKESVWDGSISNTYYGCPCVN
jgi:site-specific DNA-cytosine methylase